MPIAAYLGFHFPFIFLTHLSGCLAYLQSLVLILGLFCSLSGIAFTWATVYKFLYASYRQLHTLSIYWSHRSHTYVKCAYVCTFCLTVLQNTYILLLIITHILIGGFHGCQEVWKGHLLQYSGH